MERRRKGDRPHPAFLIRFEASDGITLSGLLFEPERRSGRAAVFLHGTGGASIFDARRTNLLAAELTSRGIAFFPFDNRGSHIVRRLRGKNGASATGGSAHERIRDATADIDGAVRAVHRLGYREVTLIGHSTGANKIAVYDAHVRRNRARRYIFLAGGDDTGLLYKTLGARRFAAAIERARKMIAGGRGDEIVPRSLSAMPLSWRSFLDMARPDGDYNVFPFWAAMHGLRLGRKPLFRHVRAIRKPALYVYGENDEFCFGDVAGCTEALARHVGANAEIVTIGGAGHGFNGFEQELGTLIAEWILT